VNLTAVPQDLAAEFLRRVPATLRSQYVATAIADKLREREEQLVRACEAANNAADVREIENSFEALADGSDAVRLDRRLGQLSLEDLKAVEQGVRDVLEL
jgi:hypothetical protein